MQKMNQDDFTSDLPEGWAHSSIGEAFQVNPPKPPIDELSKNAPVTFVPMSAVDAASGSIVTPQEKAFARVRKGYTAFRENDVIFAKITPCMENGKAAIARNLTNGIGFGSTEFHVLRTHGAVLPEFVFHFVRRQTFRSEAKGHMTGSVGQKRVPKKFLENAPFPVPPLAEQKRIVTKVDELMSSIERAKSHLERVPAIIENFRKAVLNGACSGRLTEDWREKHPHSEPAKQLLKQVKCQLGVEGKQGDSIDLDFELPLSWILAQISDFTSKVGSGATPRGGESSYKAEGVPLIRSQNVHFDGFRDKGIAYLDEKQAASLDAATVEAGDVLLNITGASIGRVTQAPPRMHGARVNQHVCIIRPCRVVDPVWLSCFLASPFMQDHIMKIQYGVTRQALTKGQILSFVVPIPPTEEQREIVRRVQNLFSLSVKALKRLRCATQKIEQLLQAVLAKAFSGELVLTEAELARREGRDYETAEQLLTRIKAEREKRPKLRRKIMRRTMKEKPSEKEATLTKSEENRLLEILLKTKDKKLTPEQFFKRAGFDEGSIDDFYEELRAAVQAGQIKELRPKKNEIYLEAIKQ